VSCSAAAAAAAAAALLHLNSTLILKQAKEINDEI
jgi:hypothetical protein